MKTYKLALVALAAFSLAACNKENSGPEEQGPGAQVGGDTAVGIVVSLSRPTTKADGDPIDKQEDWNGRTAERDVKKLTYYSNKGDNGLLFNIVTPTSEQFNPASAGEVAAGATQGKLFHEGASTPAEYYRSQAWKTAAGGRVHGVTLNKIPYYTSAGDFVPNALTANTQVFDGSTAIVRSTEHLIDATDGFTMTSEAGATTVTKDIKLDEVNNSNSEAMNVFTLDVERVIAQGIVVNNISSWTTVDGAATVINDPAKVLKFASINSGLKTYFWRNNAGERTLNEGAAKMSDADYLWYKGFTSAIDAVYSGAYGSATGFQAAQDYTAADVRANLFRMGNVPATPVNRATYEDANGNVHGTVTVTVSQTDGTITQTRDMTNVDNYMTANEGVNNAANYGQYLPKAVGTGSVSTSIASAEANQGIYFMENSVPKVAPTWTSENKDFGFYRLAYAKVYGYVNPTTIYKVDWNVREDNKEYVWGVGEETAFLTKYNSTTAKIQRGPDGTTEAADLAFADYVGKVKYFNTASPVSVTDPSEWADQPFVDNGGRYGSWVTHAVYDPTQHRFVVTGPKETVNANADYAARSDKSFYYGLTTGHYYLTANDAYYDPAVYRQTGVDTTDPSNPKPIYGTQAVYKFQDGKCAWRALWNRQSLQKATDDTDYSTWCLNADVRRNNTYLLELGGFLSVGMPWDSSDPTDPNLPKVDPEDPNMPDIPKPEVPTPPTPPDNPDVEDEEAYMTVRAKILPWNLVSRAVVIR